MLRLALGALWHNMGLLPEARIQPVLMHRLVLGAWCLVLYDHDECAQHVAARHDRVLMRRLVLGAS